MAAGPPIDVSAAIIKILLASPTPLRAVDISRKLAEENITRSSSDVNKILYKGPFDKVAGAGAPVWRARREPPAILKRAESLKFQVDGVGYLCLEEKTSEADLESLLAFLASLIPGAPKTLHCEPAGAGGTVVKAATKAGFQVVQDL